MLLKLPIMLWSSAPEFCLLCSIYAPHVKHYMLYKYNVLFLLLYSSLSSSSIQSSTQFTIHLRMCINTLNSSLQLYSVLILTQPYIFTKISQSCAFYTNFVNCVGKFCLLCCHHAQYFCFPIGMLKIMLA